MRDFLQRLKPYMGLLKWVIALAILGYLFYQNQGALDRFTREDPVTGKPFSVDWGNCCIAVALVTVSVLLTFVRWYLLVWAQEFDFRLRDAFRLGFFGLLLNFVAPGQVGGDIYKAVQIYREQQSRRLVAVATVVIDRILGLLALFIVGATASLALPSLRENNVLASIAAFLWTGAAVGTVGLLVMLHPATPRSRWLNRLTHVRFVGRVIGELIQAIILYQTKRKVVVFAVAMSICGHLGMLSSFYFAARALPPIETAPDFSTHLLIVPTAEVAASFVPVPGGVGVLEWWIMVLYGEVDWRQTAPDEANWSTPPPQWQHALKKFKKKNNQEGEGKLWDHESLQAIPVAHRPNNTQIDAAIALDSYNEAVRLLTKASSSETPETAQVMYRVGHWQLAREHGLLATLLFRLINMAVAAIGFVCFMATGKNRLSAKETKPPQKKNKPA